MPAMIKLKDGWNVNICTNEGATEFFEETPRFVSLWIRQINMLQKMKNVQNVIVIHQMLGFMAEFLLLEQLDGLAPKEYEALVNYTKKCYETMSTDESWRKTGKLSEPYQVLLDSVASWLKHPIFLQKMLDMNGLDVVAKLVAPNEHGLPVMPCAEVCESILMFTTNSVVTVNGVNDTEQATVKGSMKDLENSGILAQSLRFLTAPVEWEDISRYLQILDYLEQQPHLVRTRFGPDTPSGKILEDVVSGKDGWKESVPPHRERVMKRLNALKRFASMANQTSTTELGRICRKCGVNSLDNPSVALLACGRCNSTYYCSPQCQKADWKDHKPLCDPFRSQTSQNVIMTFVKEHYIDIMTEIKKATEELELKKEDLLLELDFFKGPDQEISPAMDGIFTIKVTAEILEDDRSAEPDWFFKGSELYEKNIEGFMGGLGDHYNRMTENQILVIHRRSDQLTGVYRADLVNQKTGAHITSDAALELFPQDTEEKREKLRAMLGQDK